MVSNKKGKIRVLHLIPTLDIGGAEMLLVAALPLMHKGQEQFVCVIKHRGPLIKKLQTRGIKVHSLNQTSLLSWPRTITNFYRLLKLTNPDIIATHLTPADMFGRVLGRLFGVKHIVCFLHAKLTEPKQRTWMKLDKLTSSLVSRYIAVSAPVFDWFKEHGFPNNKLVLINNGIEVERFSQAEPIERKSLGIPKNALLFINVAKFRLQKGHIYLVKAFAKLRASNPHVQLLLLGTGDLLQEIRIEVKALRIQDSVHFLGDRNDIPSLLKTADVFVLPSLYEGMSIAILEAMAAGIPIIASDIEENRELLNEQSALLVPPKEVDGLAGAMKKLTNNLQLRRDLARDAQERATAEFSINRTIKEWSKVFEDLTDSELFN